MDIAIVGLCCGSNKYGQLGIGNYSQQYWIVPTPLKDLVSIPVFLIINTEVIFVKKNGKGRCGSILGELGTNDLLAEIKSRIEGIPEIKLVATGLMSLFTE